MGKYFANKTEELKAWQTHLVELTPKVIQQIEWIEQGEVVASRKPTCPKELENVADNLVKIQSLVGEYQRNQIDKTDIETIKYYTKKNNVSFDDAISKSVENSRYVSRSAIEAKGVVGLILEIQAIYKKYYKKYGVFPINAMSAESKRNCRSLSGDVSLKDKIETIISVYLPELAGINVVEKDFSVLPQSRFQLSDEDIKSIAKYFRKHAENGKINECFNMANQEEFISVARLLARANMTVDEFLKTYTGLSYSKCYSAETIPAVKQMILSYKAKNGTTKKITDQDPYLRNKIEVAQRLTGQYSMVSLVDFLGINGDNAGDGRKSITDADLQIRQDKFVEKLKKLYPNGIIGKDFISEHYNLYLELGLLSKRYGKTTKDNYLESLGYKRESSHERVIDDMIYLSEDDLSNYKFLSADFELLKECDLKELDPLNYFGVYNKLIYLGYDSMEMKRKNTKYFGE